jgi:hypothetical protein
MAARRWRPHAYFRSWFSHGRRRGEARGDRPGRGGWRLRPVRWRRRAGRSGVPGPGRRCRSPRSTRSWRCRPARRYRTATPGIAPRPRAARPAGRGPPRPARWRAAPGTLQRLRAGLGAARDATDDPGLDDILREVELRAAVELAKAGAGGAGTAEIEGLERPEGRRSRESGPATGSTGAATRRRGPDSRAGPAGAGPRTDETTPAEACGGAFVATSGRLEGRDVAHLASRLRPSCR